MKLEDQTISLCFLETGCAPVPGRHIPSAPRFALPPPLSARPARCLLEGLPHAASGDTTTSTHKTPTRMFLNFWLPDVEAGHFQKNYDNFLVGLNLIAALSHHTPAAPHPSSEAHADAILLVGLVSCCAFLSSKHRSSTFSARRCFMRSG